MSGPPITLIKAAVAPVISTSSSGERSAFLMESVALSSESDSPTPIMAIPPCSITVLTSAKSRLTNPGRVISSVIPLTARIKTSSETLNACASGRRGTTSKILSFGMTITVSATSRRRSRPISAFSIRVALSLVNGKVTIAIVNAPTSFATFATTGADPVPVPPPRPAVTNTMLLPDKTCLIWSSDSIAASSPRCGIAPAPRPLVVWRPIKIRFPTLPRRVDKCCASVFNA